MTPDTTVTRRVGTCSHCGSAVLLRVRPGLLGREARCACGATIIPNNFLNGFRDVVKRAVGK